MDRITYHDFDLQIEPDAQGYRVEVLQSPAGEASGSFVLPFTAEGLENLILRAGALRRTTRGGSSNAFTAAQELGGKLFESVFSGEVLACLRRSLDATEGVNVGLRLRFRLQEVPEIADLPWEFLYDRSMDQFLVQSTYTPLVRYLDLPRMIRPLTVSLPLNVLAMVSSPRDSDLPQLDTTQERAKLEAALAPLAAEGKVRIRWLEDATLASLQKALSSDSYHVFHYIGHGGFDSKLERGDLVLEDQDGRALTAPSFRIGPLLHDHRSLRLAVLNSCEGARNSREDPFAGIATSFVRQGIPAVVAMQFEITDTAAIAFASGFYSALAQGFPVDGAVAEARKAILFAPNDVEWSTPVLYMRSPDGVLFDIDATLPPASPARVEVAAPAIVPAPASTPPAAATRLAAPTPGLRLELHAHSALPYLPRASHFELLVFNDRDREETIALQATSADCLVTLPASVTVASHTSASVPVVAKPQRRRLFGGKRRLAFSLDGSYAGEPPVTAAGRLDDYPYGYVLGAGVGGLGVVAALLFGIFGGGGGSSGVSGPHEAYSVVYASSRGGNQDIYLRDLDAGTTTRLTTDAAADAWPSMRSDGGRIVFVSERGGASEIYTMTTDGSLQQQITQAPQLSAKHRPMLSPNGRQIAFDAVGQDGRRDVYVVGLDGTGLTNLTPNSANDYDPSWSPDGGKLVFASDRSGNLNLYILDLQTKEVTSALTYLPPAQQPVWSPDGLHIAFTTNWNGYTAVYVINRDGSSPTKLSPGPFDDFDPAWTGDGTALIFVSRRSGGAELYSVALEADSAPNQLTYDGFDDSSPSWSVAIVP